MTIQRFAVLLLVRAGAAGVSLVTCAYALLNCSPFAFDMFIRPQLFPPLGHFVAWHHLLVLAGWAATAAALLPDLRGASAPPARRRLVRLLVCGYIGAFGLLALRLLAVPFLPTLWHDGDGSARGAALLAVTPLLWLAAVDHAVAWPARRGGAASDARASVDIAVSACGAAAAYFWLTHAFRGASGGGTGSTLSAVLAIGWSLTLVAGACAVVCLLLVAMRGLAMRTRAPETLEHLLLVCGIAAAAAEFLRRFVFPSVAIPPLDAAAAAAALGAAVAATWSGLALRWARTRGATGGSAFEILLFAGARRPVLAAAGALLLTALSFTALRFVERLDWNFVLQRSIVLVEAAVLLALCSRIVAPRPMVSARFVIAAPLLVLGGLVAWPRAAALAATWTGDRTLEPAVSLTRGVASEIAFGSLADLFVARAEADPAFHRFLQVHAGFSPGSRFSAPDLDLASERTGGDGDDPPPDIFLFVIDSLRRDYLSPYNPAVSFTPHIGAFAEENYAFRNAFTRHGGTELAMASIWSGASVVRTIRSRQFHRMNALEKLVNRRGYRVAINDFTIAEQLSPSTPVTRIDQEVPSVDTDLCRNLEGLERYLTGSPEDRRPVFAFFAPMNVHILNTRKETTGPAEPRYAGFYAPYAARLERLDACFGSFLQWLRATGRYENAIVIVTSDHGDSLGENGYWGHAMWLFPEGVRIPLILKIPERMRGRVTTDLARLAFSSDIAPTLYALLGYPVAAPAPVQGEPLFVPAHEALSDRRRGSYLLTSSYGATYGLLRRNGRQLYVSDLVEWREFAFDLSIEPIGVPMRVDDALRRVSQERIRREVERAEAFYGVSR